MIFYYDPELNTLKVDAKGCYITVHFDDDNYTYVEVSNGLAEVYPEDDAFEGIHVIIDDKYYSLREIAEAAQNEIESAIAQEEANGQADQDYIDGRAFYYNHGRI